MPVFISYSHKDKGFVNKLAAHLVKNKAHVWVDTWELKVGDSLVAKVQDAIQSASALLVVLSKASVESEWCKRELNAGLVRELEEKRVVVLPILLEDCDIPIFLKEKLYADFRSNFDEGLRDVLEAIARVTNDSMGRMDHPDFHVDWAVDWFYEKDRFCLRFTLVEQAVGQPCTVLTEAKVLCNENATSRYQKFEREGLGWFGRLVIIEALGDLGSNQDLQLIIEDHFPKKYKVGLRDSKVEMEYEIEVTVRRLGEDTGKDILLDLGGHLSTIRDAMRATVRQPSPEELLRITQIVATPVQPNHPIQPTR